MSLEAGAGVGEAGRQLVDDFGHETVGLIRRYRDLWPDPRLIVCVFHNNDLNQVTWELRAMGGSPKFAESQTLPDVSYADVARSMGLKAVAVDTDDAIGAAWDEALAADGPTVLDIRCDPEMPPIPPHATYEQAKELMESLLKGDPERWHLMAQGIKAKAQEFIPHRGGCPASYAFSS